MNSGFICERCGKPLVVCQEPHDEFLACSEYPRCQNVMPFKRETAGRIVPLPLPDLDIACEKCGKPLVIKMGPHGWLLGCTGYPSCRNSKTLPDELKVNLPPPRPKTERVTGPHTLYHLL